MHVGRDGQPGALFALERVDGYRELGPNAVWTTRCSGGDATQTPQTV